MPFQKWQTSQKNHHVNTCDRVLDNNKKFLFSSQDIFSIEWFRESRRERGGGRDRKTPTWERDIERHIHWLLPAGAWLGPGIELETEAVPLTSNWTCNPLVCRAHALTTGINRPGLYLFIKIWARPLTWNLSLFVFLCAFITTVSPFQGVSLAYRRCLIYTDRTREASPSPWIWRP